MTVRKTEMLSAAKEGFANATDAADYLVKKGLPFREAHEVIGKLVLYCIQSKKNLEDLSLQEYQDLSPHFDSGIYEAICLEHCVNARNIPGGPGKEAVKEQIARNEQYGKIAETEQ